VLEDLKPVTIVMSMLNERKASNTG